jgi:hypothetical protein
MFALPAPVVNTLSRFTSLDQLLIAIAVGCVAIVAWLYSHSLEDYWE